MNNKRKKRKQERNLQVSKLLFNISEKTCEYRLKMPGCGSFNDVPKK